MGKQWENDRIGQKWIIESRTEGIVRLGRLDGKIGHR